MNGNTVLVGMAMALAFSSCDRPSEGTVERRFELPDSLGTFFIRLDSNLIRLDSGIAYSDYTCGNRLSQLYTLRGWSDSIYPALTARDVPRDSMFRFAWLTDLHSPTPCDSAQTVQDWLTFELRSRRIESPSYIPVDSGIVQLNGTKWAFIQSSDYLSTQNDMLECYTRTHGRGMYITWQRLAPTAVSFDFGAYTRRQLATARFD